MRKTVCSEGLHLAGLLFFFGFRGRFCWYKQPTLFLKVESQCKPAGRATVAGAGPEQWSPGWGFNVCSWPQRALTYAQGSLVPSLSRARGPGTEAMHKA